MVPLKKLLPVKFKIWLRNISREIVGIEGGGDIETHMVLLDQKIESASSALERRQEHLKESLEAQTAVLERRIEQLEELLREQAAHPARDRAGER